MSASPMISLVLHLKVSPSRYIWLLQGGLWSPKWDRHLKQDMLVNRFCSFEDLTNKLSLGFQLPALVDRETGIRNSGRWMPPSFPFPRYAFSSPCFRRVITFTVPEFSVHHGVQNFLHEVWLAGLQAVQELKVCSFMLQMQRKPNI